MNRVCLQRDPFDTMSELDARNNNNQTKTYRCWKKSPRAHTHSCGVHATAQTQLKLHLRNEMRSSSRKCNVSFVSSSVSQVSELTTQRKLNENTSLIQIQMSMNEMPLHVNSFFSAARAHTHTLYQKQRFTMELAERKEERGVQLMASS